MILSARCHLFLAGLCLVCLRAQGKRETLVRGLWTRTLGQNWAPPLPSKLTYAPPSPITGGMAGRLHLAWAASAEEVSAVSAAMPALGVGGEGLLTFLGL